MIDLKNKTPRTVKTPDGYGEVFSINGDTVIVKVPVGEKKFLRIYTVEQCEEVKNANP